MNLMSPVISRTELLQGKRHRSRINARHYRRSIERNTGEAADERSISFELAAKFADCDFLVTNAVRDVFVCSALAVIVIGNVLDLRNDEGGVLSAITVRPDLSGRARAEFEIVVGGKGWRRHEQVHQYRTKSTVQVHVVFSSILQTHKSCDHKSRQASRDPKQRSTTFCCTLKNLHEFHRVTQHLESGP